MKDSFNTQVAAVDARHTYRKNTSKFDAPNLDTAFAEATRDLAEKTVAQTRQAYDHSKKALDAGVDAMERSFDGVGQGAAALNRKIVDIAQRNVNSGFDLAKSLAGAKDLAQVLELQGAYWCKQFGVLAAQAEEVRELSTKVAADVAEPIKTNVTMSMDELRPRI